MSRACRTWRRDRRRKVGECRVVAGPDRIAPLEVLLDPSKLTQPERGLQIRHVVLEAGFVDFVVLEPVVRESLPGVGAETVQRQTACPSGRIGIRGNKHPTLRGDDVLGHVEAERTERTEGPRVPSSDRRLDRVRAVLDHHEIVRPRQSLQMAETSHGRPAKCTMMIAFVRGVRHRSIVLRGDAERCSDRYRQARAYRRRGRRRSQSPRMSCSAGSPRRLATMPEPYQREVQGCCARVDRHCMARTGVRAEVLFELRGAGPRSDPPGSECGHDLGNVLFQDLRLFRTRGTRHVQVRRLSLTTRYPAVARYTPRAAAEGRWRTLDTGIGHLPSSQGRSRVVTSRRAGVEASSRS